MLFLQENANVNLWQLVQRSK